MSGKINWEEYFTKKKRLIELDYLCNKISIYYATMLVSFCLLQIYITILQILQIEKSNKFIFLMILLPFIFFLYALFVTCRYLKKIRNVYSTLENEEYGYVITHRKMWSNVLYDVLRITIFIRAAFVFPYKITIVLITIYLIVIEFLSIKEFEKNRILKNNYKSTILSYKEE